MEEGTTKDEGDEATEESYLEYTRAWLQLFNWGALQLCVLCISIVIITMTFIVVNQELCSVEACVERQNTPQMCPYIFISSDILALNGWLMHGGILWLLVDDISMIIR